MRSVLILFSILSFLLWSRPLLACEFCTIAQMGKKEKPVSEETFVLSADVLFEHQDWKEIPAVEAHELHHDGHHVHDKQDEEIIHAMFTLHVQDRLSFNVDVPYVTRHFIEIDSHPNLGSNETSQGLGDITVTGDYRFIQDDTKSFGIIGGVKTPSGGTDEQNSFDGLIEPELQPGSGSIDYIAGLVGSLHPGNTDLSASAVYVYKTEGDQDFRFGDVFSVSFFAGRKFVLKDNLYWKAGLLQNNQLEKKQNSDDGPVKDSGGYTMLVGPEISLGYDRAAIEFAYLFPAVQNLGGVHQELDQGIWTGALNFNF